jgi:hypothetical protein
MVAGGAVMAITVIHGPMATGKTFHAVRFKQQYCCNRVLDGWPDDGGSRGHGEPRDGDLILTTRSPTDMRQKLPDARYVDINTARRRVGLPPAPKQGFRP